MLASTVHLRARMALPLVVIAATGACASDDGPPSADASALAGTWNVEGVDGDDGSNDTVAALRPWELQDTTGCQPDDGCQQRVSISGNDSCNSFTVEMTVDGETLMLEQGGTMTLAGCSATDAEDQGAWEALQQAMSPNPGWSFQIQGDELALTSADGVIIQLRRSS